MTEMKIALIILIELIAFINLFSQVQEIEYESNFAPYGLSNIKLILKSDSSFIWKMKVSFGSRTFGGSWEKRSDTLFLHNEYINYADDPFNPGTDSIITISTLNKYIIKRDRLYATINNKIKRKSDGYFSRFIYKITFGKREYINHRYYLRRL